MISAPVDSAKIKNQRLPNLNPVTSIALKNGDTLFSSFMDTAAAAGGGTTVIS